MREEAAEYPWRADLPRDERFAARHTRKQYREALKAEMLSRMYRRWAERKGYKVELVDYHAAPPVPQITEPSTSVGSNAVTRT